MSPAAKAARKPAKGSRQSSYNHHTDEPWGISVLLDELGAFPYRKLRLHGDARFLLKNDAVGKKCGAK
jgi:hypothetical protein